MRIIRGEFAGKSFVSPKSELTRPTSDKVRQAIFNILEHNSDMPDLRGSTVLDVFAGSGGLGFEALSRGAAHVTFVDSQRAAVLNLYNTIAQWGVKDRTDVIATDVLNISTATKSMDYVFCDPPYGKNLVNLSLDHLYQHKWLSPGTTIIAEMHKQDDVKLSFETEVLQEKRYGDTKVLFLSVIS